MRLCEITKRLAQERAGRFAFRIPLNLMVGPETRIVLANVESAMNISVAEAQTRLAELIRRAESGEDVVLIDGDKTIRLQLVRQRKPAANLTPEQRRALLEDIAERASAKVVRGPDAARSQDFLYDDYGLPA